MFLSILVRHVLPFVLGALVGIGAFYLLMPVYVPAPDVTLSTYGSGSGSGSGFCRGKGKAFSELSKETDKPLITSKPQATYTDAARQNNTEGTVRLKVTLLRNGSVGAVTVINGLPDGLTEQAIAAAREIKFEPKKVNGVPVSTTVTIDYGFDIY